MEKDGNDFKEKESHGKSALKSKKSFALFSGVPVALEQISFAIAKTALNSPKILT